MHQFGLRVSEGRRRNRNWEERLKQAGMIETYRSFAKVFFWLLVRHLCWCKGRRGQGRGRKDTPGFHILYNSKCELAYETLSTYGLVFSQSLSEGAWITSSSPGVSLL